MTRRTTRPGPVRINVYISTEISQKLEAHLLGKRCPDCMSEVVDKALRQYLSTSDSLMIKRP